MRHKLNKMHLTETG